MNSKYDTISKTLRWFAQTTLFCAAAIYGLIYNVGWAKNILFFACWVYFAVTILLVILVIVNPKSCASIINDRPPKWRLTLNYIVEIGLIALFAGTGHFVIAAIYTLQVVVVFGMYEFADDYLIEKV